MAMILQQLYSLRLKSTHDYYSYSKGLNNVKIESFDADHLWQRNRNDQAFLINQLLMGLRCVGGRMTTTMMMMTMVSRNLNPYSNIVRSQLLNRIVESNLREIEVYFFSSKEPKQTVVMTGEDKSTRTCTQSRWSFTFMDCKATDR